MSLTVRIQKRYGGFRLDADFSVESGGALALLGASGCGKSVTLKCIAGIDRPDAGRIELDGRVLFDGAAGINLPPQRRRVGVLFQNYALFPNMTVEQNVAVCLGRLDRRERRRRTAELLALLRLEEQAALHPRQLSGGQRQRAALARVLAAEPRALLLDEPFSALDFLTRVSMQEWLLEQWEKHKKTILFITHDVEEAVFLSGSVLAVAETPIRALSEAPVPAPYPRTRACLTRPDTVALREELIGMLRKQVRP